MIKGEPKYRLDYGYGNEDLECYRATGVVLIIESPPYPIAQVKKETKQMSNRLVE